MKSFLLAVLLAALLLWVAGCTTSHALLGPTRPPTDPKQVKVYSALPKRYDTIATVSANSRHWWLFSGYSKAKAPLARAKAAAARLGATGLLLQGSGETGLFGHVKTVSGVAIFVTEE